MQEFTVTDGRVEYAHTKPLADYENKVGRVSFSFTVAEGSDPQVAASKVLSMAMELVEGQAIQGKVMAKVVFEPKPVVGPNVGDVIQEPVEGQAIEEVIRKPKPEPTAEQEDEDIFSGKKPSPKKEVELEPKKITLEDLRDLLPKVTSHLREQFGHVNDLRKLIASFNVKAPFELTEDQRPSFVEKCKGLLAMKKEN